MKRTQQTYLLFGIFAIVGILAIAPSAFADTAQVTITKGAGASADADCVNAKNCFDPNPITVAPGTEIEWKNTDTVAHTVTSGLPTDSETGTVFDSGMIKAGNEFKFTFQNEGTYDYFCMVHPWMTGQVIVSSSSTNTSTTQPTTPSSSVTLSENVTTSSTSQPTTQMTQQTTTPSSTTSTTENAASTSTPSSGQGQQGGIPLGGPYESQPAPSDPNMVYGWSAGLAVAAILSGVGIWSAARRR